MKSNRTSTQAQESPAVDDRVLDAMIGQTRPRIERAMKILRRPQARVGVIPSQLGRLLIAESDRGIAAIHFLWTDGAERTLELLRRKFDLIENEASARRIEAEIERVFDGDFSAMDHPLDLSLVESDFKRRAYTQLRKVPVGAVITYHQLAATIGQPDAQRAVGTTMATNPIPIFVPCHRVIRSDGTIGNYGGGQFELGVGRGQNQYLASLFHADAPNDVAPTGFNLPDTPAGLPSSPLAPVPAATGFRWG